MRVLDAAEFYTRRQTKRLFALKPAATPTTPSNISVTGGSVYLTALGPAGAVDLTVTPGASAESLQGYELEFVPPVSAGRFYTIVPASGSYHIASLQTGVSYAVRARAIDYYGGVSSWSAAISVPVPADTTAPAKPSIQVTALDAGALIKINALNGEADFLCYVIDRATNSQFTGAVEIIRTFATAWHDRSIPADGLYFYRVRAIDRQGNFSPAETFGPVQLAQVVVRSTAPAAPPSPTNMSVTDMGGSIQVSWTSPFISNLASIRIWRRTSTSAWSVLAERASNSNASEAYLDTAVQPGVTYFYSLQALDKSGLESAFDSTGIGSSASFTALSTLTLSAVPGVYQDVVLTWNYPAATQNEAFEPIRFDLYRQAIPSGTTLPNSTDWDLISQAYKTTRFRDTGLEPNSLNGTKYIYQLSATDRFSRSVSTQSSLVSAAGAASAAPPVVEAAAGDVVITAAAAALDTPDINGNQRLLVTVTMTPPSPIGTFHGVDLYRARPDTAYPQYIGYFPYSSGTWTVTFSDDSPASVVTDRIYAVSSTVGGKKNSLVLYGQPSPTPNRTYSAGASPTLLSIPAVTSPGLSVNYVEDSADILAELTVSYTAPSPLGSGGQAFEGVQVYLGVDGILEDFGWRQFNGVAGAAVSFPIRRRPPLSDQNITVYLPSRNQTRQNPLNLSSTPHAQVFVLSNPYPSGAGLVTSFAASAVYDVSESGDDVYSFTGTWALPTDITNFSKVRLIARNLTYPSTPDVVLGDYDYPTTTFQTDFWPITEAIQYKLYAISCGADGTPNAISGSTPSVTITVQPQVGGAGQERAPNVTGFTASVVYGYAESGDDGYRFQGGFTFPGNLDKFRGAVIVARKSGSPDVVLTGVLFGPTTTPTFQTQFFSVPSVAETWDLYAVSVDANNRQNSITGSTPKVTVTVQPQVGPTGVERVPLVTGFTASVYYTLTEAGDERYGFQGSWTNPTDLSKFRGVKIIGRTAGANDAVLAVHSFTDTTFRTDSWPVPSSPETWTLYPLSIDANNRTNSIVVGGTPSVTVTVSRQGNSATTGLENAPNVTSPSLTAVYSVTESGDERYQLTGSFTLPSPAGRYRGLRVIGKVGSSFYEFTTLGASVTTFATDYAPVPFTPQSMRVYFVSIDANNRTNSISDSVTPYIDITIQRQGNSVSPGIQVAPVVTSFAAAINYVTSVDGVEMYNYSGSWVLPADLSRFRGVKIYEALNVANEATWTLLSDEGEGSTTFKTDYWPVPSSPRSVTILAISADANNRENAYQAGVTPAVTGTVQTGGTGSLNMTRVNSTTIGAGLGQDGSGRLRSTLKAENAVSNPDFEYGLKDWTVTPPGSISVDTANSFSGTNSLRIDFTGLSAGSVLVASELIPVRPGDKYVMSAVVVQSGASSASRGELRLYQRDKTTLSTGLGGAVATTSNLLNGAWNTITTGVVTIPSDCFYVRACPCTTGTIPGGTLFIDSVVVVRVPDETYDSSLSLQGSGTGTRMGVNTGQGLGRGSGGSITSTQKGENLLTNPDFEFGLTDWNTYGTVAVETSLANVYSGNQSIKLSHAPGSDFSALSYIKFIPVKPGETYMLSAMLKHSGQNVNSSIIVNFYDINTTFLGSAGATSAPNTNWTQCATNVFTIPANTASIGIYLIWASNTGLSAGSVWIDSVSLIRIPNDIYDPTIALINSKFGLTDNAITGLGLAKDPNTGVLTASIQGQNLVPNGGFEAGLKEWSFSYPQYFSIDTSVKYSGSQSLKLDVSTITSVLSLYVISNFIPTKPGDQLRMTVMVRQAGGNNVVGGMLIFYDQNYTSLAISYTNSVFTNNAWASLTTNIVTAPAGTAWVRFLPINIYTQLGAYTTTGQVWIDSALCERLSVDVFENTEFQVSNGFLSIKNVNLAKSINFSTEFEVSSGALRMKELAADKINTGILSVGGGGSKVSKFAIFNSSNQAIGWIGVDSGYEGAWFKRILIGGTAPASAKIVFDALGNGAITGDLITGTIISANISSNNITTGTLAGSAIVLNSSGITTTLNNEFAGWTGSYTGLSVKHNFTGEGGYVFHDSIRFYDGVFSLRGYLWGGAGVTVQNSSLGNYFAAFIVGTPEVSLSIAGNKTGFYNGYFIAGNYSGITATFKAYDPITFNPVTITVKGGIIVSIV